MSVFILRDVKIFNFLKNKEVYSPKNCVKLSIEQYSNTENNPIY